MAKLTMVEPVTDVNTGSAASSTPPVDVFDARFAEVATSGVNGHGLNCSSCDAGNLIRFGVPVWRMGYVIPSPMIWDLAKIRPENINGFPHSLSSSVLCV
jgi:hypothetical protein